jgi:transposase
MLNYDQFPSTTQQIPTRELWELIDDLGSALEAQAECLKTYEQQIAAQEQEIMALRAVQASVLAVSVAKTSANSSLPPASQRQANRPIARRDGQVRRSRPQGVSRRQGLPDVVMACVPQPCAVCGAELEAADRRVVGRQRVVELPEMKVVTVELVRYERTCACGHCQRDAYPDGYQQPHQVFGPRLQALITYLNGTHHIAHDRLQGLLHDVFQCEISAGALVNSLHMTARRLKPAAAAILQQLRQSEIIGSDETGLRCEGRNTWLWVLQNEQASYFAAVSRRSGQVLHDLLGDCRIPLWVSDLYAGQLNAPAEQFAVCNAHQLRELQYAIDCGDPVFAPSMQMLLREGLLLSRQRDLWHTDRYTAAVDSLKHCAHSLIDGPSPLPITRRLQNRFRKHFDKIWHFLDDPRVPFDNNASERALRPAVIHRKVVGGFRSLSGAQAYACYRTVEDTARKRKQPIWDALFAALGRPLSLPLRLAF